MEKVIKPLTIYYCGREKCRAGHYFGPAVRAHYLMHFVLKGKGIYRRGKQTYELQEGEAFLIKPQEVTYYQADKREPWEYAWIAFDGREAERVLEEAQLLGENCVCQMEAKKRHIDYLKRIVEVFEENGYHELELLGYLYLILSSIQKKESDDEENYSKGYLDKAIGYIRHNYSYNIHISDISRHVGIERTYLYKIFMKYQKISPKQYLTRYRILAAKDMLDNTKYNITEIALSCGFHDSSVFCKSFHKEVHVTPLQYRKTVH